MYANKITKETNYSMPKIVENINITNKTNKYENITCFSSSL